MTTKTLQARRLPIARGCGESVARECGEYVTAAMIALGIILALVI